jgi:hypothetical protein
MCFLAIWISYFEKVLFSSVAHFFIGSLIWGVSFFELPVYFSYQSIDVEMENVFSHSVDGLLSLETISFVVQLFNFM